MTTLPRTISATLLNAMAATLIMATMNQTFWSRADTLFDGHLPVIALFGGAVWALTMLILSLFAVGHAQKPVLVFLLILSAVTSYYQDTLGATIDRDMIQNAVTTTVTESKHLITPQFALHVLLLGIVPSALVLWLRIKPAGLMRRGLIWAGSVAGSAALCVGLLMTNMQTYSVVLRGNKELMISYQPGAPLGSALRYAKMSFKTRDIEAAPYGVDAKSDYERDAAKKPVLLVVVVGETARAMNWSLNGYARETNPELAKRDIVNFTDVSSCGTATAVSMPCMFSHYGRADYSYENGLGSENLLDVFGHAGYHVEWWDANTGDKGIAARFKTRDLSKKDDPENCAMGECRDGVFLPELAAYAAALTQDTVLVIHMIGSHGPAYYLRYPKEFNRFTPTCDTGELKDCSLEEITNTYDNTILYSDHVLAQMIDLLDAQSAVTPALFYASDHGESLGENGLFLHGAPYFMAPETQTRVPMMLWLSDRYAKAFELPMDCVKQQANLPLSHDNMFHSLLMLADVHTTVEDPALDLLRPCHPEDSASAKP